VLALHALLCSDARIGSTRPHVTHLDGLDGVHRLRRRVDAVEHVLQLRAEEALVDREEPKVRHALGGRRRREQPRELARARRVGELELRGISDAHAMTTVGWSLTRRGV